jgi:hypothetical protein
MKGWRENSDFSYTHRISAHGKITHVKVCILMVAHTKMNVSIYDMQHQDYLYFTDKATFFQQQATNAICFLCYNLFST